MSAESWQLVLIFATLAVAGFSLYLSFQAGNQITLSSAVEEIKSSVPVALELKEIAELAVASVEQLRREGKITDNNVAFTQALDLTKKWIPDEWEVDNIDIIAAINAAVLVASALSSQAGESSESVK